MKKFDPNTIVSKFSEIIEYAQSSDKGMKGLCVLAGVLGLTALLSHFRPEAPTAPVATAPQYIDTHIPHGKSLVNIEVANYESLDQIIGQYGVVDLYSLPLAPGERAKLVMRNVKLVRTAKNSPLFSVLLPAEDVGILAGATGAFTVGVRNPESVGTKIVKERPKARRRQIYFETEIL